MSELETQVMASEEIYCNEEFKDQSEKILASEISQETKESHLPSWVLRMRQRIEESRNAHSNAECAIANLHKEMAVLTTQLRQMIPQDTRAASSQESSAKDFISVIATQRRFQCSTSFCQLTSDVFALVFQYLSIKEIYKIRCITPALKIIVENNPIWILYGRISMPFLFNSLISFPMSSKFSMVTIIEYLKILDQSLYFIRFVKEQRCLPKHRMPGQSVNSVTGSDRIGSFAHVALEGLVQMTSRLFTDFSLSIIREGVLAVMVSLLTNEDGSIQNYASAILANVLCWEATKRHQGSGIAVSELKRPLRQELDDCNGDRILASLLTSPSASVNLAGRNSKSTYSRVQSVCNKHASRALIVLFYPDLPVISNRQFFQSRGIQAKQSISSHSIGLDNESTSSLISEAHEVISCDNTKESPSVLNCSSANSTQARAWQFTYFYKSGAFKEQCVTYLEFDEAGLVSGGGEDSFRSFVLQGEIDVDIVGKSLYFTKSYLKTGLAFAPGVGVYSLDPDRYSLGGVSQSHFVHVGFWSEGVSKQQQSERNSSVSCRAGVEPWSIGLWGVWETCGNQSHYDLQNGGVFRAIPI